MRRAFLCFPALLLLSVACDPAPDCGGDLRYDPDMHRCVCDHEWDPDTGVCYVPDAGVDGCIASAEICNGRDDDCDGDSDEAAATAECSSGPEIVSGACTAGACVIASCREGSADCNRSFDDGCEVDLTTNRDNCGSCGTDCSAAGRCVSSICEALPATRWIQTAGSATTDRLLSIGVGSGLVAAGGSFGATIAFGDTTLPDPRASDGFVVVYDALGEQRWVQSVAGPSGDFVEDVVVVSGSRVCAVGSFRTTANFGALSASGTELEPFIVCYDTVGAPVWVTAGTGPLNESARAVASDDAENLYVVGGLSSSIRFGSLTATSPSTAAHNTSSFLLSVDPDGGPRWMVPLLSSGFLSAADVTVSVERGVCLVGEFTGTLAFGDTTTTSSGDGDSFVACFDPATGASTWVEHVSSTPGGTVSLESIAAEADGALLLGGGFVGAITAGTTTLAAAGTGQSGVVVRYPSGGDAEVILRLDSSDTLDDVRVSGSETGAVVLLQYRGRLAVESDVFESVDHYTLWFGVIDRDGQYRYGWSAAPTSASAGAVALRGSNAVIGAYWYGEMDLQSDLRVAGGADDALIWSIDIE